MSRNRYREVYKHYAALIDTGKMKPGDQLPTRPEITKLWDISYATVNKAISALRDDLYVYTTTLGTFVHLSRADRLYQQLCDVMNALEKDGQNPHLACKGTIGYIVGREGSVRWDPEAERWEKPTA